MDQWHVFHKYGTKKKTVAVTKLKQKVSIGLIHLVFRHRFLKALTLVFTLMKNDPRQPPIMPITIDPGSRYRVFTSYWPVNDPNFSDEPFQSSKFPFLTLFSRASENVANEQEANTFQIMENRQNVLGLDIS